MTRLLFLSNVHGDGLFLSHVLEEGRKTGVDGLLVSGDLGGDRAWPVHPEADERDRAFLEQRGVMPYPVDATTFDGFASRFNDFLDMKSTAEDMEFLDHLFKEGGTKLEGSDFGKRSLSTVLEMIETFCADNDLPCLMVPGSGDIDCASDLIAATEERTPLFKLIHGKCADIGDIAIVGLGRVVATDSSGAMETLFTNRPASFFAGHARSRPKVHKSVGHNEIAEGEAGRLLGLGYKKARGRPVLLLSHTPPFASGADLVVSKEGQVHPTGSSAVRTYAMRTDTLLVNTGHIRACTGLTRIGETLVVNTGQLAGLERPLYNVRNVVDEIATSYVPVAIWEPMGGMAAIAEVEGRDIRASPIIVTEHVENA